MWHQLHRQDVSSRQLSRTVLQSKETFHDYVCKSEKIFGLFDSTHKSLFFLILRMNKIVLHFRNIKLILHAFINRSTHIKLQELYRISQLEIRKTCPLKRHVECVCEYYKRLHWILHPISFEELVHSFHKYMQRQENLIFDKFYVNDSQHFFEVLSK